MESTRRKFLRRPYRALTANAENPGVITSQLTACYTTLGVGRAQIAPPAPRPMPYINTSPSVSVIGDNSQAVNYRPFLRRWTGSAWAVERYGPVFTATTSGKYTTWNQNGGTAELSPR